MNAGKRTGASPAGSRQMCWRYGFHYNDINPRRAAAGVAAGTGITMRLIIGIALGLLIALIAYRAWIACMLFHNHV